MTGKTELKQHNVFTELTDKFNPATKKTAHTNISGVIKVVEGQRGGQTLKRNPQQLWQTLNNFDLPNIPRTVLWTSLRGRCFLSRCSEVP